MYQVDVAKVRGKMGERRMSVSALAKSVGVCRDTMTSYLKKPEKIPFGIVLNMANTLCESKEEASEIFFSQKLS